MKNLFKFSTLSFFVFCFSFISTPVFAVYVPKVYKAVVIADVNVSESKIISQEGNIINLSYVLTNNDGAYSGLKYGVSLLKKTANGNVTVDEFISTETFGIGSKENITKEFKYTAPSGLSGEYTVLLKLINNSGLVMGMGTAGKVNLVSSLKTIQITSETCYLTVVDEKGSPKYSLDQGVDIGNNEVIALNCSAVNNSKTEIKAVPVFETHLRDISGEIVEQKGGSIDAISFKAGEKKNISILLSKAIKPQAYDVKVSLKEGENFSNGINVHYVLRGLSATIQNISLDKDYYNRGDNAIISVLWAPSADSFNGNRSGTNGTISESIVLFADIKDTDNDNCIKTINIPLSDVKKGGKIEIPASITSKCENPKVSLSLKDSQGNILDSRELSFESKVDAKVLESNNVFSNNNKIIFIIIGIIIALGLVVYFISLNKKNITENIN